MNRSEIEDMFGKFAIPSFLIFSLFLGVCYWQYGRSIATELWWLIFAIFCSYLLWTLYWIFKEKPAKDFKPIEKILEVEYSVIGKSRDNWYDDERGSKLTLAITAFLSCFAVIKFFELQYYAIRNGATDIESWIYGISISLAMAFLYWVISLVLIKHPKWHQISDSDYLLGFSKYLIIATSTWLFLVVFSALITLTKIGSEIFDLQIIMNIIVISLAISLVVLFFCLMSRFQITTLLGVFSAWILLQIIEWSAFFFLIEATWDVVWANRVLVMIGQLMTESMTQDYFPSQNWRIWLVIYMVWPLVGGIYGTMAETKNRFLVPFSIFSFILVLMAWNPTFVNYDSNGTLSRLLFATVLAIFSFLLSNNYSVRSGAYLANRLRSYFIMTAVVIFFSVFIIMDPPESVQKLACDEILYEYETKPILDGNGYPLQSGAAYTTSVVKDWECMAPIFHTSDGDPLPIIGKLADGFSESGLKPSQWGGLFVNLFVAAAGCVLGFGIGVVLAFGRQSNLPLFKYPSIGIIELVRSGPLICWLYFAMYLLPDVVEPTFKDPEDFDNIVRMMLIFGIFGGCYIAEVIRGGLQSVDSGQREAAIALGLNPIQTKLQIELPNAIRTTLPSIVSVFIGLWKDTTLLFIINILDFFKLAKDSPNTDMRFLGDFIEPVYFSAIVFWVVAFYLSRVSMRMERNLGLVREGGGGDLA
jgi:His/Glu/Gln/Arg/opine family amino acid ABC transporter permease subunit